MIDITKVRKALREHLLTVVGLPVEARRAWEGVKFDPPQPGVSTAAEALWIRETLLIAGETLVGFRTLEVLGEYRIDVFSPDGLGLEDAEALGLLIANKFEPKGGFTGTNGVQIHLVRTVRKAATVVDDVWLMVPVVVGWSSYTPPEN